MPKIVNCTPHALRFRIDDSNDPIPLESDIVIEPSNIVTRCLAQSTFMGFIGDIPYFRTLYGNFIDVPEQKEDTFYVVSGMVRSSLSMRHDILTVCHDRAIRDANGQIFAVRGLQQ